MKRIFGRDKPKMTRVTNVREIPIGVGPGAVLEENSQYPHIYNQHRTVREAVPQQRSMRRSSTGDHREPPAAQKDDENHNSKQQQHREREREPLQNPRPPALTDSRSSSLASLPPGASPPIASPHGPRSGSPYSNSTAATTQVRSTAPRERDRDNDKLRKAKQPPSTAPGAGPPHNPGALSILKSLDPFPALDVPIERESKSHKHDHAHPSDEALGDERKEKKSFWGAKDREKEKGKERKDEESPAELTRMIGYLTATASEDWSLVLEVCDRASASEANAREAVKALRREFKYAEPSAQLSAARLWAIMLRNSSEIFMQQIMSRKFLDTLEEVLTSSRTSPVVRERLMDVLAAVAYASQNKNKDLRAEKESFRGLWRKLKPADKPDEGVPFDIDDAMFNPPMPRPTSEYELDPQPYPPPRDDPQLNAPQRKQSLRRNRIIPPEEDMRRLFQECKIGNGNAQLLSESLTFAKPEDLRKEIIREFYVKCRASQELIYAQIPWAYAGAERSRLAQVPLQNARTPNGSYPNPQSKDEESPRETTVEEDLLAALLESNEALFQAINLYDDLERVAVEREAEEISRRDVRMDRRQLQYQEEYGGQLEPPPSHIGGSSSRSPSPSPTDSPALSFQQPAFIPSITHPLPRIPGGLLPGSLVNASSPHLSPYPAQNVGLVPPPPAPHGPRSPAQNMASRTPSPERFAPVPAPLSSPDHHSRTDSSASSKDHSSKEHHAMHNGLDKLQIGELSAAIDDDEECITPIKPSAKALGKRRVIEVEEADRPFDTDDIFYDNRDDPYPVENRLDSDSDELITGRWQQTTRYVYDAAAERTQQRIRRGRVSTLVDGVH